MEYLQMALGIIILLGLLIFVHELGHFLVAKMFGIRVEVFSLGFGKKIIKKTLGETEYCVSLIPLGGYVKLLGEDPTAEIEPELAARSFSHRPVGQRFAVVLAGPVFNVVFAMAVIALILFLGKPTPVSIIGRVIPTSAAWQAGFRPGDRITKIGKAPINLFSEIDTGFSKHPGQIVPISVTRDSKELSINVVPEDTVTLDLFGSPITQASVPGIRHHLLSSTVGVSNPSSIAGTKWGLATGDRVIEINGKEVNDFSTLSSIILKNKGKSVRIKFIKEEVTVTADISVPTDIPASATPLASVGLHPMELFILKTPEGDSPALAAGLQKHDRLVSIDDEILYDWEQMREKINSFNERNEFLAITFERKGVVQTAQVKPKLVTYDNKVGNEVKRFLMGIETIPELIYYPGKTEIIRHTDFALLPGETWDYTAKMTSLMGKGFYKLLTGEISPKSMGGPILIGQLAGNSFLMGLVPFLEIMAIISLNLGYLNLLPIPVLDGGHLMFFTIEAIIRKPLSLKKMEMAQRVGITIIFIMMIFVFYNDIVRLINS